MIRTRASVLAGLLLALLSAPASAQEIRGTVRDISSERPVGSAVIMLLDEDGLLRETVLSDESGRFEFPIPVAEALVLRVQRYGFATVQSVSLRLTPSDSLRLEIRVRPVAINLAGITATGELVRSRNLERFLTRQQRGYGKYLSPGDIARLRPRNTNTLLASVPGSPLTTHGSGLGIVSRSRDTRNEAGTMTGTCIPTVYVDGLILPGEPIQNNLWPDLPGPEAAPHTREAGVRVESVVSARTVRAVEVYQRPAHAPPEFQRPFMPECTVVLIWTDYGFGLAMSR